MLTTWPAAPLRHAGQEAHRQLHRGEIVQPHQPLDVVQAIVGILDRAPDRATGVVDEDVDPAVLRLDLVDQRRALRGIGDVGAVGLDLEALGGELLARQVELLGVPRDDQRLGARPERDVARSPCRCRPNRQSPARACPPPRRAATGRRTGPDRDGAPNSPTAATHSPRTREPRFPPACSSFCVSRQSNRVG